MNKILKFWDPSSGIIGGVVFGFVLGVIFIVIIEVIKFLLILLN